jgi:predicted SAM-dependent methyltransferase
VECKVGLKGLAFFELKSWLGRKFIDNTPKLNNELNYLNLGCGNNGVDGYVNADFFYRFKFWKRDILKREWQLDLRYPLVCKNEVFDGIFTEHTLEHLYPSQAKLLLLELYRVLKKGSYIRITVPDIEKYVLFYNKSKGQYNEEEFKKRYDTGCSGIRNITQNYFHFSTWDFEELQKYLKEAGFVEIEKKEFGQTFDKKLNLDLKDRSWETLYIEAKK